MKYKYQVLENETLGTLRVKLEKNPPIAIKTTDTIVFIADGKPIFDETRAVKVGDALTFVYMSKVRADTLRAQQEQKSYAPTKYKITDIHGNPQELDTLDGYKMYPALPEGCSLQTDFTDRFTYPDTENYVFCELEGAVQAKKAKLDLSKIIPIKLEAKDTKETISDKIESTKPWDGEHKVLISKLPPKLNDGDVIEYKVIESFRMRFKDVSGNIIQYECKENDNVFFTAKLALGLYGDEKIMTYPEEKPFLMREDRDYTHLSWGTKQQLDELNAKMLLEAEQQLEELNAQMLLEAEQQPHQEPQQQLRQEPQPASDKTTNNFNFSRLMKSIGVGGAVGIASYGAHTATAIGQAILSTRICVIVGLVSAIASYLVMKLMEMRISQDQDIQK